METEGKRLNKYISDAGVCSRREADRLIAEGRVEIRRKSRKDEAPHERRKAEAGDRVFHGDTVYVDGKNVLSLSGVTLKAKNYLGLSAATGGSRNEQKIRNFKIR